MEVTLERLKENGAYAYEAIFLTQLKSYSFGQMSSNDFILYAPTVEYNHCIFHNKPNGLFVEVLKSSSAVLIINGKKYLSNSVVHLNNNDIVNIGLLLKYKVNMKAAIPFDNNYDYDYVKSENDMEDGLLCHNVNDSNIGNLRNKAALCAETIQSEISDKVTEKPFKENQSGLSLQEIDAVMQIEIVKEENAFENPVSNDSSAAGMDFFDSLSETESYHSPLESKFHEFATEANSDSFFEHEHLTNSLLRMEHLPNSSSEKETLSDFLPEKVPLFNSSSKEKNLPSAKHSLVSLTEKEFCLQLSSDSKKRLTTESSLKKPKRRKQSEEPFRCRFCDKLLSCKQSLDNHLLLHEYDRPFECNKCNKCFLSQQRLRAHSVSHNTERPFVCDLCGKRYKSKGYIRLHLLRVHCEEKETCKICKKVFGTKQYLQRHMVTHSTEKKFKCPLCEKGFRRKQELQRHTLRKLHTNERLFKCKFCQKQFLSPERCEDHQRIHTGEKS